MRTKTEQKAIDQAVEALNKVSTDDPESAHGKCDAIVERLLETMAPEVMQALAEVQMVSKWWATA